MSAHAPSDGEAEAGRSLGLASQAAYPTWQASGRWEIMSHKTRRMLPEE